MRTTPSANPVLIALPETETIARKRKDISVNLSRREGLEVDLEKDVGL